MKKQALPVWALPAAGAAIGGTAGLLGGINIDDPRITPSIRAKKLLRCLLLGGVTGLGLEGMRQGGKLIFKQSSYKPKGYLLRDLLLKQAVVGDPTTEPNPAEQNSTEQIPATTNPAETPATTGTGAAGTGDSWFSGNTWGVPNHYLVGGGIGALGGLTLYHLLNDKRKRRPSGYLGAALAGLGVGALGAGVYRWNKGYNLFGGNAPGDKVPTRTVAEDVADSTTNLYNTIDKNKVIDNKTGEQRFAQTPAEAVQHSDKVSNDLGATYNWWWDHVKANFGQWPNPTEENYAKEQGLLALEKFIQDNPNATKEEQQAHLDTWLQTALSHNPQWFKTVLNEETKGDVKSPTEKWFAGSEQRAVNRTNTRLGKQRSILNQANKNGINTQQAQAVVKDIKNVIWDQVLGATTDGKPITSLQTPREEAPITYNPEAIRAVAAKYKITDPTTLSKLDNLARRYFEATQRNQGSMHAMNTHATRWNEKKDAGREEYLYNPDRLPWIFQGSWASPPKDLTNKAIKAWMAAQNERTAEHTLGGIRSGINVQNAIADQTAISNDMLKLLLKKPETPVDTSKYALGLPPTIPEKKVPPAPTPTAAPTTAGNPITINPMLQGLSNYEAKLMDEMNNVNTGWNKYRRAKTQQAIWDEKFKRWQEVKRQSTQLTQQIQAVDRAPNLQQALVALKALPQEAQDYEINRVAKRFNTTPQDLKEHLHLYF